MASSTASNSGRLTRIPASLWISFGMVGSGAGQFAARVGDKSLPTVGSVVFGAVVNSASTAIGLFIASPTVALMIIRHGARTDAALAAEGDMRATSVHGGSTRCRGGPSYRLARWGASAGSWLETASGCLLLASSPFVEVLAATQRGMSAASGRWSLVALQLVADGVLRAGLGVVGAATIGSVMALLLASWLPTVASVAIVRRVSQTPVLLYRNAAGGLREFKTLVPLWATGLAEHAVLTLSPNIVSLFSRQAGLVEAFSLLMFCVRIPITLATVVLTPLLVKLSSQRAAQSAPSSTSWLRRVEVVFVLAGLPVTMVGTIVGPRLLPFVFSNDLLRNSSASMFATTAILLLLLATTTQQLLWSESRFAAVASAWAVAVLMYLALMPFAINSLARLMLAMSIAAGAACVLQSLAARREFTRRGDRHLSEKSSQEL